MSDVFRVCQQLHKARLDAQLTLKEVADRIGVTQAAVSNWEWQRCHIRSEHLFAWARALDYDVALIPAAGNDRKMQQSVHADATTATRDGER